MRESIGSMLRSTSFGSAIVVAVAGPPGIVVAVVAAHLFEHQCDGPLARDLAHHPAASRA